MEDDEIVRLFWERDMESKVKTTLFRTRNELEKFLRKEGIVL